MPDHAPQDTAAPPPAPALPRRLAALLYDTLLVLPLVMVAVALAMGLRSALAGGEPEALHPQLVQVIALVTVAGFFIAFWRKSGQTLGMQAWRIRLVASDGGRLRVAQLLRRCLGALLSAACLGAGYWWCLFDRRRRYWHDYLSGTELVLLEKRGKGEKAGNNRG